MESAVKNLAVLWVNGDREVALQTVYPYCIEAKVQSWWKEVRLIAWGPSARTLSEDPQLQKELKKVKNAGVVLEACKSNADRYGVSDNLTRLGFNVKLMGLPFTQMLKGDYTVITV